MKIIVLFTLIVLTSSKAFGNCNKLIKAAYGGLKDTVAQILKDEGTDINCTGEVLAPTNGYLTQRTHGATPLHGAIYGMYDARGEKRPTDNHLRTVQFLIGQGADVNVTDSYGQTIMLVAAMYGDWEMVQQIYAHRGSESFTKKNRNGFTPESIARYNDHEALANNIQKLTTDPGQFPLWKFEDSRETASRFLHKNEKEFPPGSFVFWQRYDEHKEPRSGELQYGFCMSGSRDPKFTSQEKIDLRKRTTMEWYKKDTKHQENSTENLSCSDKASK